MKRSEYKASKGVHRAEPALPSSALFENSTKSLPSQDLAGGTQLVPTENIRPREKTPPHRNSSGAGLSLLERIRATYPGNSERPDGSPLAVPASSPQPTTTTTPTTTQTQTQAPPQFPGFRIVAVAGPLWPIAPDIVYSPDASSSERRSALDQFEWSDLVDARIRKRDPEVGLYSSHLDI